jgi:N-acetylmuramoyl-L-alanine amidase
MRRLLIRLLFLLLPGIAAADEGPVILGVRLGEHPGKTRIVFDLSARPEYRVELASDPYRLVIDLRGVDIASAGATPPRPLGLVQGLHLSRVSSGLARIVVRLRAPVAVDWVEVLPAAGDKPLRLIVDVAPADAGAFDLALARGPILSSPAMAEIVASTFLPRTKPMPPREQRQVASSAPAEVVPTAAPTMATLPASPASMGPASSGVAVTPVSAAISGAILPLPPIKPEDGKPVIIIDAGHGGIDPGAIGASGTLEKEITLAYARAVAQALAATGRYHVVLTRKKDNFIRLRQRIAIARGAGADLFLSLHADKDGTSDLRGASVYTLSEQASDAEAEALATTENKADIIAGVDLSNENQVVTDILIDLAQRETQNLSARFAGMLVLELKQETKLLHNTHRFAGFAVLKAPDVPAVLVELGYLSSRQDESLLASPEHRTKMAAAIVRAANAYFDWRQGLKGS